MRINDVIAPMDPDEFRDSYLDQRWVVIKGSPKRYEPLVPWSDLNTALHELRIPKHSNRLRLVKDGKEIPGDTYLRHGVWGSAIRTGAFERQLSDGATLVLNGVDELFGEVRELADDANKALGGFAWANLYAGWRTQRGFDLHWDDHDTVILQVHGRKAWTVYAPTCEHPTKAFAGSAEPPQDPPVWEGILEAGSVLYMPRGWWHFAVPLDEPTLHVTLGMRALTGEDVLRWAATQLHSQPVFRANVPHRSDHTGQQAYLAQLRETIVRALSDDCLERIRDHVRAEVPRFPLPGLPDSVVPKPAVTPDSLLLLAGARELKITPLPDGQLSVAVNGGQLTCSSGLAEAMARLSGIEGVRFDEVCAGLTRPLETELKLLLTVMLHQGSLVLRSGAAAGSVRPVAGLSIA